MKEQVASLGEKLKDTSYLHAVNNPNLFSSHSYREIYSSTMNASASELVAWMKINLLMRGLELPKISVVLGTGLGQIVNRVEVLAELPFTNCRLPATSADGHAGRFVLGVVNGSAILLQSGRIHCYEDWSPAVVALSVRAQALAGVRTFLLTNAAGGLDPDIEVGDVVLLTGHSGASEYSPSNRLYDTSDDSSGPFGQKFYPVNGIYCPQLRHRFAAIAAQKGIKVHSGVYQFMPGPRYEEPNEIARFVRERKSALHDNDPENALIAVGMSTAPEAYALAQLRTHPRFGDIRILGISNITNKAAGIGGSIPTSEEVLSAGPIGGEKIISILEPLISELG